jgi:predicted secreted hydrolase
MSISKTLIKKGRATNNSIKGMLSLAIIVLMIVPTLPVHAEAFVDYMRTDVFWKTYPYYPPGTDIVFPYDEGAHDVNDFPIEWWYANFQITGQITGNEYGAFVAFYNIHSTVLADLELRMFSIADISAGNIASNTEIGTLSASDDHLDLSFEYIIDYNENSVPINQESCIETEPMKTTMTSINQKTIKSSTQSDTVQKTTAIADSNNDKNGDADESPQYDHWYTKTDGNDLLPFQYTLVVGDIAQQDSQPMSLTVDMDCLKQPLIAGGNGFLDLGLYGYSCYYSLTRLAVTGTITVHGITEAINGSAWIDHQWSYFLQEPQPPFGLPLTYEWFSLQLDDNREIMVADTWDRITGEKIDQSFMGGLNLLNSDGSLELLDDYTITPLASWNDTTDHCIFSAGWNIIEPSKSIDLIVTPVFNDQVMRARENYPVLQQIFEMLFSGAFFWEGVCTVSGTIDGNSVNTKAYVELTHSHNNGDNTDFSFLNDGTYLM